MLLVYVLEASRTSGDNNATIIVGDAMSGAAWVAASSLAYRFLSRQVLMLTEPGGSAVRVEVVNLGFVSVARPAHKLSAVRTSMLTEV